MPSDTFDLRGRISVFVSGEVLLDARIYRFERGSATLGGRVAVKSAVALPARLYVKQAAELPARIEHVVHPGDTTLAARVTVTQTAALLRGRIDVQPTYPPVYLNARIEVRQAVFGGRLTVVRRGGSTLAARITVPPEMPGPVLNLFGDIPQKTWQESTALHMSWDHALWQHAEVTGYYYNFGQVPDAPPDTTWATTGQTAAVTITAQGPWYFTVAARNTNDRFGPARTWEVWFNHWPTPPAGLKIDGKDTVNNIPVVSKTPADPHLLQWTASADADAGDVAGLRYEIQWATQVDFGTIAATGQPSIVQSSQNVAGTSMNWATVPNFGRLFWRIRSSDGKQSSDWSPVGSVLVNQPPGRVKGMTVRAT